MTLSKNLKLTLEGQCPSGKNAIVITRTGHRFPQKRFKEWRDSALEQIESQIKIPPKIAHPVNVIVHYWAQNRIRRDTPGIEDALWHVLEKAGIVEDDRWLGAEGCVKVFVNHGIDKENPRVEIIINESEGLWQKLKRTIASVFGLQ